MNIFRRLLAKLLQKSHPAVQQTPTAARYSARIVLGSPPRSSDLTAPASCGWGTPRPFLSQTDVSNDVCFFT